VFCALGWRWGPAGRSPGPVRLHSGEAFSDGGLVFAMFWALELFVLTLTGLIIYFKMQPKVRRGIQKVFW
jgi:hypothetical protein